MRNNFSGEGILMDPLLDHNRIHLQNRYVAAKSHPLERSAVEMCAPVQGAFRLAEDGK